MLEEEVQLAPAVCASLSNTMVREREGGQPLWEGLEIPQLVHRLEWGKDFYESCFLTKKGEEKKPQNLLQGFI